MKKPPAVEEYMAVLKRLHPQLNEKDLCAIAEVEVKLVEKAYHCQCIRD